MKRFAPAVSAHDDEIVIQLLCMGDDAFRYISDFSRMHMKIDCGALRKSFFGHAPQVVRRFLDRPQMALPVHYFRGILFYRVKQGHSRSQFLRKGNGNGQGRFRKP